MVLIRTSTETWSAEYTVQGNRDAQIVRIKSRSSITVVIAKIMENLPLVGTTVTYYICSAVFGITHSSILNGKATYKALSQTYLQIPRIKRNMVVMPFGTRRLK